MSLFLYCNSWGKCFFLDQCDFFLVQYLEWPLGKMDALPYCQPQCQFFINTSTVVCGRDRSWDFFRKRMHLDTVGWAVKKADASHAVQDGVAAVLQHVVGADGGLTLPLSGKDGALHYGEVLLVQHLGHVRQLSAEEQKNKKDKKKQTKLHLEWGESHSGPTSKASWILASTTSQFFISKQSHKHLHCVGQYK